MANKENADQDWVQVIGRSLALIALHDSGLSEATLAQRAGFLEALGVGRHECADMLGTSYQSITELFRQAKKKKGVKRSGLKRAK